MFIIYGTRSTERTAIETNLPCPACAGKGLLIFPYQNYAHVFFIPFFPTGRDFIPVCPHCQAQFPEEQIKVTPKLAPIPPWSFTGLALVGSFLLWVFLSPLF